MRSGRRWAWVLVAAVAAAGCRSAAPPGAAAADPRPSILVITVDALRADRLGVYGYQRPTSPFLDRLAASATVWDHAYSTSSWTVPAVVSLLSGVAPRTHGVVHGVAVRDEIVEQESIPVDLPLLAEVLHDAGYATYAVVTNPHLASPRGFARGFDRFELLANADAAAVNQVVAAWAPELVGGAHQPVFLWLHYFDPHHPYLQREPYFTAFAAGLKATASELETIARAQVEWPKVPMSLAFRFQRTVAIMSALYDSEIRFFDDQLARLFAALPALDDFMVVVTSDHGEEFREHGRMTHGFNLYNETARVPLLIRPPRGGPARRSAQPVSLLDLPTTLASSAAATAPAGWQGACLSDGGRGSEAPDGAERPVLGALSRFSDHPRLVSLVWSGYKLIKDVGSGRSELYSVDEDPHEQSDLAETRVGDLARMEEELARVLARTPEGAAAPTAFGSYGELVEKLRALGYVE